MMEEFDFDKVIERHGTGALKTDALLERYGNADLLPLWVADMDFATPEFIRRRLHEAIDTPVLGYKMEHPRWREAICKWQKKHHNMEIRPEWLTFIPGIVKGFGMAINFLTKEDDGIIIQPPVYHPFRLVPEALGRKIINNPLIETPNGYAMDFEGLEKVASQAKMMILCNPHNPGGKVWSPEDLRKVAEICHRHGVIVISDEIHADMVHPGHRHTPFATVSKEAEEISITFGSPSKSFNIPGLATSWASVPNIALREKLYGYFKGVEFDDPALLQQDGTVAAYEEGEEWLAAALAYIEKNIDFTIEYAEKSLPGIKAVRPEASFLVWLDCRDLGLNHEELIDLFVGKAKLALNDGEMFGPGGEGFMRINVATPRSVLQKALDQLKNVLTNPV